MQGFDVTDGRGAEPASTRSSEAARAIVDAIRDPALVLDQGLRIAMVSRSFARVFGRAEAEILGRTLAELRLGQWDVVALVQKLDRVILDAAPIENFLIEDEFPGLGRRVFRLDARRIEASAERAPEVLLVFEDVTRAVAADRHKDLLAAELAHRIKNSLSVISAFLALEVSRGPAPCRDGYRAMQTRLKAVASLYGIIARSSSLGPVDIRAYLAGIGNGIRDSLIGSDGGIEIAVDAEPLAIDPDRAVSVGLLVNELATNAIKHAFPQARGRIVLGFRRSDGGLALSVRDDGIGLDAAASQGANAGMGMRFVDAFVRELHGSLSRKSGPTGTTVTVTLPPTILAV